MAIYDKFYYYYYYLTTTLIPHGSCPSKVHDPQHSHFGSAEESGHLSPLFTSVKVGWIQPMEPHRKRPTEGLEKGKTTSCECT